MGNKGVGARGVDEWRGGIDCDLLSVNWTLLPTYWRWNSLGSLFPRLKFDSSEVMVVAKQLDTCVKASPEMLLL